MFSLLEKASGDFFHRHLSILSISALILITVLTYANSLNNSFHYDDFHGIVRNPAIKDLRNVPSYFTDPSTFSLAHRNDWRPVLQTTYALNYLLGRLKPAYFRIWNLLFHVVSAWLIYITVTELARALPPKLPLDSKWRLIGVAMPPALLFAVHPANSEVVNYIWARSSLLAALFYLIAFYCFLRGPLAPNTKRSRTWHLAGLATFVLGLATKATTLTLPAVLICYKFLHARAAGVSQKTLAIRDRSWIENFIPVVSICLVYVTLRAVFLPETFTRVVNPEEVSAPTYLLSSFRAWVHYLRLFLWPSPLLVNDHAFGWSSSLLDSRVLVSLGVISAILAAAWRARRSDPLITFFTLWFFIALLPESSFIPLSEPVNGYRPYLAYVGVSVVTSLVTQKVLFWLWTLTRGDTGKNRRRFWIIYSLLLAIISAFLVAATRNRNLDWRNEKTLWNDVLKKDPSNPRARMVLGLEFLQSADYVQANEMFEAAVTLDPKNSYAHLVHGYFNAILNRNAQAIEDLTKAVALSPRSAYNFYYRGEVYAKIGEHEKALNDYRRALSLKPMFTDAYYGMAMVHWQRREIQQATESCNKILQIDRTDAGGYSCLGGLLREQKRYAEAARIYQMGVALVPDDDELWYYLAIAYGETGMYREAAVAFETSAELRRKSSEKLQPATQ